MWERYVTHEHSGKLLFFLTLFAKVTILIKRSAFLPEEQVCLAVTCSKSIKTIDECF